MGIHHPENPRDLKNHTKYTLPVFKRNTEAWMAAPISLSHGVPNILIPIAENYCLEKNYSFQNTTGHSQCTWSLKKQVYNKIKIFMPTNMTSISQPMDQAVV